MNKEQKAAEQKNKYKKSNLHYSMLFDECHVCPQTYIGAHTGTHARPAQTRHIFQCYPHVSALKHLVRAKCIFYFILFTFYVCIQLFSSLAHCHLIVEQKENMQKQYRL